MNTEEAHLKELQAQMDEWQVELDKLEARPETRIQFKERIEALWEQLLAGAAKLNAWRSGSRL